MSVTFLTEYGGSGATYDNNSMINGGHRVSFIPCAQGTVDMAAWCKLKADETNADRQAVASDKTQVEQARDRAEEASVTSVNSMNSAAASAQAAEQSAADAAAIYASVSLGLSNTNDGQYFKVVEQGWLQLYRNDSGAAIPEIRLASQETLERLNTRLDPMLTSLLF